MDARTARQIIAPFYAQYCHKNDCCFTLTDNSTELAGLLGYGEKELDGVSLRTLVAENVCDEICEKLSTQISEKGETGTFLPLVKKNGEIIWVLSIGRLLCDEKGEEYVYGIFAEAEHAREVTNFRIEQLEEFRTKVNSLQVRAEQDAMTGLLNAGTTRSLVKAYLTDTSKNCAMLVIDVDDFKRINDRYGHMVGDKVMICAASTIKKLFRSNDIVGRIGGDEFLVLMKDVPDRDIVELRCSQIVAAFNAAKCEYVPDEVLSCSVGAAFSHDHGNVYDSVFCAADAEMYKAKGLGGSRYLLERIN